MIDKDLIVRMLYVGAVVLVVSVIITGCSSPRKDYWGSLAKGVQQQQESK